MAKYFRTISPLKIIKDYSLQNEKPPPLYQEFDYRMIYWPLILSIPYQTSDDITFLYQFNAFLLSLGTLIFMLLAFRLGGISGAVCAAAFWIGTPLINYWGHFFMSENPSFIFIALGYFCLLFTSKSRLSAILGGFFIGFGAFIRFTSIILIFPAPFLILAVYFYPEKRKNFQLLGEGGKLLIGFVLATFPLLLFNTLLSDNPLQPFFAARSNVENFPVKDPFYYLRNLWLEIGPEGTKGAKNLILFPFVIAIGHTLARIRSFYQKNRKVVWYIKDYFFFVLYYFIIIAAFLITSTLYHYGISDVPHKLPRYMMGGLIPVFILAAITFSMAEKVLYQTFLLLIKLVTNNFNQFTLFLQKQIKKNYLLMIKKETPDITQHLFQKYHSLTKKNIFISLSCWLMIFVLIGFFFLISMIPGNVWQNTMDRPFYLEYQVPDKVLASLKDQPKSRITRLQPEYNKWELSINERFSNIQKDSNKQYDQTQYLQDAYISLFQYLNQHMKANEVLYVDFETKIPFTPAYVEGPTILIEKMYNYSLKSLIKLNQLPYKGYCIGFSTPALEYFTLKNGKTIFRSIRNNDLKKHPDFKFIKKFGYINLYYYRKGKDFPWFFGSQERREFLIKTTDFADNYQITKKIETQDDESKEAGHFIQKDQSLFQILFHTWLYLFDNEENQ
ncbi:MAG: hypothetical protein MJB14_12700 [Spirochaetes bacterium]|nr:hypothetical protein [Spirochaetota bacterium]